MKKEKLMEMAEEYRKREGFKPGAIVLNEMDIPEIMEVYKDMLLESDYERLKTNLENDSRFLEKIRLFNMGFRLVDKKVPLHLDRQTGSVTQIKPKDMGKAYNPVADITNSMGSIIQASLAFFDDLNEEDDPEMCNFACKCAEVLHNAKISGDTWEEYAMPLLDAMCKDVIKSKKGHDFFIKFFLCTMDFYWHCCRLSPEEPPKKNMDMIKKATQISALIRTMPKYMRDAYMDHVVSNGTLPEVMGAVPEED